MNKSKLLPAPINFGLLLACAGIGWWLWNLPAMAADPVPAATGAGPKAAEPAAVPPTVAAASPGVPPEKGSLDAAGKFVPKPAQPAGTPLPPMDSAAAEAELKKALKIEETAPGEFRIGLVSFSKTARTVRIPAKVNMRDGAVEYVLTTETGKAHETVLTTKAAPRDFHMACLLLSVAADAPVEITATWETNGPAAVVPLASLVRLQDKTELPGGPWPYGGSRFTADGAFAAQAEGSFISLISDSNALVSNPGLSRSRDDLHSANPAKLPRAGLPITLVFKFPPAQPAQPAASVPAPTKP